MVKLYNYHVAVAGLSISCDMYGLRFTNRRRFFGELGEAGIDLYETITNGDWLLLDVNYVDESRSPKEIEDKVREILEKYVEVSNE